MSVRNSVKLIGRLTKVIEIRKTQTGKSVASFSFAVDSGKKDQEGKNITNFFTVTAWDKAADNLALYAHKGNMLAIEGELSTRSYAQDGVNKYVTEVIVREWLNLSPRTSNQVAAEETVNTASTSNEENFLDTYQFSQEEDF